MSLFSKSVEAARNDVTKAEATVTEWEAKAATVRAEARELDQKSGEMILADETQAEKISIKIQSLERTARAYDQAAAEARRKMHSARRGAFEVEAIEEDKQAAAARKRGESHESKVDALLAQMKELDECEWVRAPITESVTGNTVGQHVGKGAEYDFQVTRHSARAAIIRYFVAVGKLPSSWHDLNTELGTNFNTFSSSIFEIDGVVPESVREAQAAGLSYVGA